MIIIIDTKKRNQAKSAKSFVGLVSLFDQFDLTVRVSQKAEIFVRTHPHRY